MGGGMGMRTIWISLRAINYTERVFREVIRGVGKLSEEQKLLNQEQIRNLRIGNAMIMTGMMMATVGQMMLQNLWQMALSTREGAMEMSLLKREIDETKVVIADTIYEFIKVTGILAMFHGVLEAIRENEFLRKGMVLFIGIAAAVLILVGGLILLAGAIKSYLVVAEVLPEVLAMMKMSWLTETIAVRGTALAYWQLALAVGAGVGIFFLLKDVLGPIPAALIGVAVAVGLLAVQLWLAAGAVSVLTFGLAAIAGAAALAGVIAMVTNVTGKQMGTRGLSHTGLFLGHKGEVVYNPATGRPTQIARDMEEDAARRGAGVYYITNVFEHVHTQSKIEDLDKKVQRSMAKAMKRKE